MGIKKCKIVILQRAQAVELLTSKIDNIRCI